MSHRVIPKNGRTVFAAVLAFVLLVSAVPSSDLLLIRIDKTEAANIPLGLEPGLRVIQELRSSWIALIPDGLRSDLSVSGVNPEVLDGNIAGKTYFLVHTRRVGDSDVLKSYGSALRLDDATSLFWTESGNAREILPSAFKIKWLNLDNQISRERRELVEEDLRPTHPDLSRTTAADIRISNWVAQVQKSNLSARIQTLQTYPTRYASTAACESAGTYLYNQFIQMGLACSYEKFTLSYGAYSTRNIVATLTGKSSPGKVVVVCAHYDSYSNKAATLAPGADDNASGTAAVLEIARVLAGASFDYTVKFICFSAEEWGLYGSANYAAAAANRQEDIVGVINLDMIAYSVSNPYGLEVYVNSASNWLGERFRTAVNTYAPMTLTKLIDDQADWSDHSSFWDKEYSALCGIEEGSDDNPYYHETTDTLDKLNMNFAVSVTKATLAAVADLAQPTTQVPGTAAIGLSKTSFNFGTERNGTPTPAETVVISNEGTGTLNWTATPLANWLGVTPGSGTGAGVLTISISRTDMTAGQYSGTIAITAPNATNSPQTITVNLTVKASGTDSPPFGSFATPTTGTTVASSVPVTGWVLDDIGLKSVKIYRGTNITNRIYIGDAMFVEGARPDVKNAYPTYPQNTKAGWGYMLLTNFLPNNGNGTFTLLAYAKDTGDHEVLLGSKTITCDNAHAVKPFGAIDTPTQGGTALGAAFVNFGWALTPQPNSIPTDGSTIWVYVDGAALGHPTYNNYRKDIATQFPGYANSSGAIGYDYLDTTGYTDGVHTIVWSVADSGGNMDGIGSRYFTIQNAGGGSGEGEMTGVEAARGSNVDQKTGERRDIEKIRRDSEPSDDGLDSRGRAVSDRLQAKGIRSAAEISAIPEDGRTPVFVRRGYRDDQPAETVFLDADGSIRITIPEVSRVAVYLNEENTGERVEETAERGRRILKKTASTDARYEAFQLVGSEFLPLPIGASFDSRDGVFYWQPGPGFLGEYKFVIVDLLSHTQKIITILIV